MTTLSDSLAALWDGGYSACRVTGDMTIDKLAVESRVCGCGGRLRFMALRHRQRRSYVGLAICRRCKAVEEV